jgi:hypothetical protein
LRDQVRRQFVVEKVGGEGHGGGGLVTYP